MTTVPSSAVQATRAVWREGGVPPRNERTVPEETPIALTYGRITHAVMMATPADLEDFATGFSLAEGIVSTPAEIERLDIVVLPDGVELRMDLAGGRQQSLERRRRRIVGPGGCGLCGVDSLTEAVRAPPPVASDARFLPTDILAAMAALAGAQLLNDRTRAVHAAGFWTRAGGLIAVREDVGRHNALDKLLGCLRRGAVATADGLVLLSSRVSVEMVQKACVLGAPVLAAVSAPTALAIRTAAAAGLTLIGVARADGFEVFTHQNRIETEAPGHAA